MNQTNLLVVSIRNQWTPGEDSRLITAVDRFGARNWNRISLEVRTRSSTECQARWRQINFNNVHRPNRRLNQGLFDVARRNLYYIRPQRYALNLNQRRSFQLGQTMQAMANPIQNTMSLNCILTHDRNIRMELGYILENPVPHYFRNDPN
ncbi:hypothetical protein RhiirA5_494422 [Rhizophagus irregularis]|uniref:Uncharacterized protein n=3 Tax=Rhizophagus irregularis TaxID=588596 RepID=A0A2N0RSB2_9GLOM|nr:hypothetical protein GLOIN_2v1523186 [Rhizophagus irregularis DAOM 181602=DAOM 197198]EXX50388.1 hypothetical protein RirG_271370 [Rhizophagus irregularis DAOM 197198w]PKC15620.1 hypothetical protein RhiirA5_494422 [Rhizophagus irregularis]PKC66190.1 hypothetical protein RhiirA1_535799 [Rhizophagus irregularis]POG79780.1 hypothetical protein GLOIN_2v1523186 [Rhizophagus irregularis DAOM 181602=DAOM 197198]UZO04631.1 hypothetical protein OCT59_025006 [Rhizophagus irregularis]|eukprot:XP_025186646.1 hypothetical protein GLOIN_2v1523186 [Rhizophagus irregularis DAOM 181602=DAOM 197198]